MEGETSKEYSDFASMTFTFELYECNQNGEVAQGATAKETATASKEAGSYGQFKLSKLKYTQDDFKGIPPVDGKRTREFYYVIKEKASETTNNVKYDAEPVYVKVVATDTEVPGSAEGVINFEIYTASKPAEGQTWNWNKKTGTQDKVYDIGNFDNTYEEQKGSLKVKKTVNGDDAKGTYKIAVKNSEGHYFDTDGSDKGTEAFYVEFSKNDEKTWANLTKGT